MAQRYGFFNSVNNDRVYDASDVANFLSKFFTNGVFNNSLAVSSNDNMTVSVAIGSANINGYAYENTEVLILDIDEADSTLSRIDSVICRLDLTNRQINVMILQGNYATTPSQPSITRTGTIYDLRLANISVPAGATRITADMITDTRFGSDCGNVVGTVQQIDTTDVFNQYETYFNNWFKTLEDELSENQAGNLQNQINNLNNLVNENDNKVGELNNLNTTDKSSMVNATNEVLEDLNGLLEVTAEIVVSSLSLPSGDFTDVTTKTITKEGYYPLGIVGYNMYGSTHQSCNLIVLDLSNKANGSANVRYRVRNIGGATATLSIQAQILWRKVV